MSLQGIVELPPVAAPGWGRATDRSRGRSRQRDDPMTRTTRSTTHHIEVPEGGAATSLGIPRPAPSAGVQPWWGCLRRPRLLQQGLRRPGLLQKAVLRSGSVLCRLNSRRASWAEIGSATAEYAVATLAACGFAGLLLVVLRSPEMKGLLLGILKKALAAG